MAIKLGPDRSPAEGVGRGSVETRRFSVATIGNMAQRAISRTLSVFSKGGNSAPVAEVSLGTFLNHATQRTIEQTRDRPTTESVQTNPGQKSFPEAQLVPVTAANMEGHVGGPLSVFPPQPEPQIIPPIIKELMAKNKASVTPAANKEPNHSTPEIQGVPTATSPGIDDDRTKYEDALERGDDATLSRILRETVRSGYIEALRRVNGEAVKVDESANEVCAETVAEPTTEPTDVSPIPPGPHHVPPQRELLEQLLKGLKGKWKEETDTPAQKQPEASRAAIPGSGWFEESPSPDLYRAIIDGLKEQLPKEKVEETELADFLAGKQVITEDDEVVIPLEMSNDLQIDGLPSEEIYNPYNPEMFSSRALAAHRRAETQNAIDALESSGFPWTSGHQVVVNPNEGHSPIFAELQTAEREGTGVFSRFKFAQNVETYVNGARDEVKALSGTDTPADALSHHLTETTKSIDAFLAYDTSKGGMDIDGIVDGVMATYASSLHARELLAEGIGDPKTAGVQANELMNKLSDPEFLTKSMTIAAAVEIPDDVEAQNHVLGQLNTLRALIEVLKEHNPQLMDNPIAKQAHFKVIGKAHKINTRQRQAAKR